MYLRLKFTNAKLFISNNGTKDRSFELIDYKKNKYKANHRKNLLQHVEPITSSHISNMLHVLLGERPKPKNRIVCYDRLDYIDDIADNCFLKLDCVKRLNKVKNKMETYKECMNDKRSSWNSWNPNSYPHTWRTVYLLCNNLKIKTGLYEKVREKIEEVIDSKIGDKTFLETVAEMKKADASVLNIFYDFLKSKPIRLTKIKEYIEVGTPLTQTYGRVTITNTKSITQFESYSGVILVPMDEKLYRKFQESSRAATILDGGYVYVDKVLQENEVYMDYIEEFRKVGEISNEQY